MTHTSELAEYAKARGWSQAQLAEAMGYCERAVAGHIRIQKDGGEIPKQAQKAFEAVKNGEREGYVA